jgi:hypothetical protein
MKYFEKTALSSKKYSEAASAAYKAFNKAIKIPSYDLAMKKRKQYWLFLEKSFKTAPKK